MASESVIGSEHFEHFTCMWHLISGSQAVPGRVSPTRLRLFGLEHYRDHETNLPPASGTLGSDQPPPARDALHALERGGVVRGQGRVLEGACDAERDSAQELVGGEADYEVVLFDMASRRARWLSNSAASASRISTSELSRSCWVSFTRRCAAALTSCALRRTSAGSIAQRKRWPRMASVRSRRHRGHKFVQLPPRMSAPSSVERRLMSQAGHLATTWPVQ